MKPEFPRPTTDFLDSIPHRPPFVWIDEVTSLAEDGGACQVTLKPDGLYLGPDGLRRSSYLEFMAQGFAYVRACQTAFGLAPARPAPKRAFLVSIQDAEYAEDEKALRPVAGDRLKVEIRGAREIGPITLFSATVRDQVDAQLAFARLKVFSE